jgi:hypothetical protein
MSLDIRLPIGLMFAVIGALLTVFGLMSDKAIYQRSLDINVNLLWGLCLFTFGALMFVMGRRGSSSVRPADDTTEGRAMEKREEATGIESRKRGGH